MIIVTGGAGFIGSNLVALLSQQHPKRECVVVDDLTDGRKFMNLRDSNVTDYWDYSEFIDHIRHHSKRPSVIFHLGACSSTTEWNGQKVMEMNFQYSRELFHYCQTEQVSFIYASSASVYGMGPVFKEELQNEKPLNMYAYSKFLFDQYVRRHLDSLRAQVVGLRYFNVYGPREQHKGSMASVVWHFYKQLQSGDTIQLFEGTDGYANGEQLRDFVYVQDVARVNQWFWEHPEVSGIFNVGTGEASSFNQVARAVIRALDRGEIRYVPFPAHLKNVYQSYTQADIGALRSAGYRAAFTPIEQGVALYLNELERSGVAPFWLNTAEVKV